MSNSRAVLLTRTEAALTSAIRAALIVALLVFALGPILWLIQMSLKTEVEAFRMPPRLFTPTLQNYAGLFAGPFPASLINSLKAALFTATLSLAIGVPAGYALARVVLRQAGAIRLWILGTRIAPPIAFALPFFLVFRGIGLIDTIAGLSLVYLTFNLPLVIWLTQAYFEAVPRSLEEAAYTDGASPWRAAIEISFPLAIPGLLAAGIFSFLLAWNDFFFALILTRANAQTAPVAIMGYVSFLGWEWGRITAGGTVVLLPSLAFAFLLRKYLISGLTSGALKD